VRPKIEERRQESKLSTEPARFVSQRTEDISTVYKLGKEMHYDAYGRTVKAIHLATCTKRTVRILDKKLLGWL